MTLEEVIGKTIRTIRKHRELTCKALAESVPMSRAHLSDIEHGHRSPSLNMLSDIARALEIEPADLLYSIARNMKAVK